MKGDLLKLIAQLTPGLPANTNFNAIIAANTLAQAMPSFVRNALGMLGQVSAKPLPTSFPLPERLLQSSGRRRRSGTLATPGRRGGLAPAKPSTVEPGADRRDQ